MEIFEKNDYYVFFNFIMPKRIEKNSYSFKIFINVSSKDRSYFTEQPQTPMHSNKITLRNHRTPILKILPLLFNQRNVSNIKYHLSIFPTVCHSQFFLNPQPTFLKQYTALKDKRNGIMMA